MTSDAPLLTIITPVYNRVEVIAEAVESVLAQGYPAVEHIVVDGGSTDGTLAVLQRYPHLRVISRPDEGMYFALNDGLQMAQGEVIGFLNSDDVYQPGVFATAMARLAASEAYAVAGQAVYFVEQRGRRRFFWRTHPLTPTNLWRELVYGDPAFNAWFFRREVFALLGGLDTSYRIAGDREFLLRFALAGLEVIPLEQVVYAYRVHPESLSLSTERHRFMAVVDEWLRLAATYEARLPAEGRRYLRRARVRDTITGASRSLRNGDWRQAWRYASLGWRDDFWWPLRFLGRAFTGVFRVLGRYLGFYPPL